jgi:hypothetical protein
MMVAQVGCGKGVLTSLSFSVAALLTFVASAIVVVEVVLEFIVEARDVSFLRGEEGELESSWQAAFIWLSHVSTNTLARSLKKNSESRGTFSSGKAVM